MCVPNYVFEYAPPSSFASSKSGDLLSMKPIVIPPHVSPVYLNKCTVGALVLCSDHLLSKNDSK